MPCLLLSLVYEEASSSHPVLPRAGHTHFAWDAVLPDVGVRCIQAPLCYPSERQRRMRSIVIQSPWQPPEVDSAAGQRVQVSSGRAATCSAAATQPYSWLPLLIARAEFSVAAGGQEGACEASDKRHPQGVVHAHAAAASKLGNLTCLLEQHFGDRAVVRDWKLSFVPETSAMWCVLASRPWNLIMPHLSRCIVHEFTRTLNQDAMASYDKMCALFLFLL